MTPASRKTGQCPECGTYVFEIQDYDKVVREHNELSSRFKKVRANHGLAQAQWELKEIELTEGMKYLQKKVAKQAESIRRLEEKIKRLGEQPYKEENDQLS